MTSIIEDFASINADLTKLEQAKMPTVQPDFSNSGDVTDEARKTFYGMFGYPTGGGIEDLQTCFAAAKGEKVNLKPLTIHVSPNTQEACRRSQKQIAESVSRAIKACSDSARSAGV